MRARCDVGATFTGLFLPIDCNMHSNSITHYLTARRCVQPRYSARTGSMCMKMMNDGGWAQQLGGHACPRHRSHLCRHSPHRLRRLGAASTRSRWKAALVDRRCWFSATGAIFWKRVRLPMAAGPGGAVDTQEPSAEGAPLSRRLCPRHAAETKALAFRLSTRVSSTSWLVGGWGGL